MTYEYKAVPYDLQNRVQGETEIQGILKLLNANGAQGWELDRFLDSPDGRYRNLILKRRNASP
jgi:Domain of unknown function (DUF4177)